MPFEEWQLKALAIAPKVSGILSMMGSACIIKSAFHEISNSSATTYHRLLFGMSCVDIISSFWYFLSTWPIPKGTPGVWGAMGTTQTCIAQGFFTQFAAAVPVYNGTLALYLLLISRYGWNEKRARKVEPLMHGVPLAIGTSGAIVGIALDLFNNANLWCWYAPFPAGCKDSFRYGDEANCLRGDNAWIYRYAFAYGPVWFFFSVATISMLLVYKTVLEKEKDIDKYQSDGLEVRTQSKRVASQSFWYLFAFFVTWCPATITRVLQTIPATRGKAFFPIILIMAIVLPMQGLLNSLVYFRARYMKYRRENAGNRSINAMWRRSMRKKGQKPTVEEKVSTEGVDEDA